ncbi:helix-turn-helix transcriptional regulator [Amphritea sp. 2_MG-2023]|uniref:helix-turn-helix domain-containing protein n=1 Tax=Amphritea TaxID=515417 RepID=UPI001C074DAA|nr:MULTISPECIES: helix-turn-helix transcriptional regulator [Amphritea]MBU2965909.1 helix-turn-helix domain-containing protein [Amphritea atlantica]MDO6418000.1 helix-turn-helix transcriptional regulator [Amphritea sp. 2_MG-2023]
MKSKQEKFFKDTPLTRFLTKAINESHKSQVTIAEEAGFSSINMISMIKSGRTNLPISRIDHLSEALDIEPTQLFELALQQYFPEAWTLITKYYTYK